MSDEALERQAAALEELLPRLLRQLFTLDPAHPVADLPLAQLRLCMVLQARPLSLSAAGEELGISVSAVTQIADRLERTGMAERVADPDDRRVKRLRLTPHGQEAMRSRRATRVERVCRVLARLSPEQREAILQALQTLREASATPGDAE